LLRQSQRERWAFTSHKKALLMRTKSMCKTRCEHPLHHVNEALKEVVDSSFKEKSELWLWWCGLSFFADYALRCVEIARQVLEVKQQAPWRTWLMHTAFK
jgi:hypothetical protein